MHLQAVSFLMNIVTGFSVVHTEFSDFATLPRLFKYNFKLSHLLELPSPNAIHISGKGNLVKIYQGRGAWEGTEVKKCVRR